MKKELPLPRGVRIFHFVPPPLVRSHHKYTHCCACVLDESVQRRLEIAEIVQKPL